MSHLPPAASPLEVLLDCVVSFRERGFGLSPRDLDLLTRWLRAGIPGEVVARGVAKRASQAKWDARPGEPPFFSLAACEAHVQSEWEQHRERVTGRGGPLAADSSD